MYSAVKDSGGRTAFSTGSVRDVKKGKGRYDLLPAYAIKRLAQHFENGAAKYGDENWRKGQPLRNFMDSGIRHAFNYLEGQRDEDHLAAAVWNLMAVIETEELIRRGVLPPELNDLPDWTGPDTHAHVCPVGGQPCVHGCGDGTCLTEIADVELQASDGEDVEREFASYCLEDSDRCGCGLPHLTTEEKAGILAERTPSAAPRYDGRWNVDDGLPTHWRIEGEQVFFVHHDGSETQTPMPVAVAVKAIESGEWRQCDEAGQFIDKTPLPPVRSYDGRWNNGVTFGSHWKIESGQVFFIDSFGVKELATTFTFASAVESIEAGVLKRCDAEGRVL